MSNNLWQISFTRFSIQSSIYGWIQQVYDRPVMPPHQATKYHIGQIDEVLQLSDQPQWCQQHEDTEELHKFAIITWLTWCPYSYIRQTFDFTTLYISIPHNLLGPRISNLVHSTFRKRDGSMRYTHIKVTRTKG